MVSHRHATVSTVMRASALAACVAALALQGCAWLGIGVNTAITSRRVYGTIRKGRREHEATRLADIRRPCD